MNALMESHAFAKYGIWYSEWLGQRAAGTEQVHCGEKKIIHLDHWKAI